MLITTCVLFLPPIHPYQAVLSLFNDRILAAIHGGISGALSEDVPSAVNGVLASLPTHIVVQASVYVCC